MAASRVLVVASLAMAVAGMARADERDSLSPAELLNGPSLRETGRIAGMGAGPLPAASSAAPIEPEAAVSDTGERSVQPVAAREAARAQGPQPRRTGTIDPVVLDEQIAQRFPALDECRVEVARRQRVPPSAVFGDELTLRWTIRPDGTVTATEVVALSPTDEQLTDCVKATMSQWTFARPRGGPLPVERPFKLKPAP